MKRRIEKIHFTFKGVVGYRRYMNVTYNPTKHLNYPEVKQKIKILTFFEKYGLSITKDAFYVGRNYISVEEEDS